MIKWLDGDGSYLGYTSESTADKWYKKYKDSGYNVIKWRGGGFSIGANRGEFGGAKPWLLVASSVRVYEDDLISSSDEMVTRMISNVNGAIEKIEMSDYDQEDGSSGVDYLMDYDRNNIIDYEFALAYFAAKRKFELEWLRKLKVDLERR